MRYCGNGTILQASGRSRSHRDRPIETIADDQRPKDTDREEATQATEVTKSSKLKSGFRTSEAARKAATIDQKNGR